MTNESLNNIRLGNLFLLCTTHTYTHKLCLSPFRPKLSYETEKNQLESVVKTIFISKTKVCELRLTTKRSPPIPTIKVTVTTTRVNKVVRECQWWTETFRSDVSPSLPHLFSHSLIFSLVGPLSS